MQETACVVLLQWVSHERNENNVKIRVFEAENNSACPLNYVAAFDKDHGYNYGTRIKIKRQDGIGGWILDIYLSV